MKKQIVKILISAFLVTSLGSYCYSAELEGRVIGNKESLFELLNTAIKKQPQNEKELIALTQPSIVPINKAIVFLSKDSIRKHTVTDKKGFFSFSDLTPGMYELTAFIDDTKPGQNNVYGFASLNFRLDKTSKPPVELRLRPDYASVCGNVVNAKGTPIKDAKVTATYSNPSVDFQQYLETRSAPEFTTHTDADGSFELHGIPAANAYDLMGLLVASKEPKSFITITVQKDEKSFTTDVIPVITETQLKLAQDLLEIYRRMPGESKNLESHTTHPVREVPALLVNEICKKMKNPIEYIPVPQSQGHVITEVDIVLEGVIHEN